MGFERTTMGINIVLGMALEVKTLVFQNIDINIGKYDFLLPSHHFPSEFLFFTVTFSFITMNCHDFSCEE